MSIQTVTVFFSSYAPDQRFATAEAARDFEKTVIPRLEVIRIIAQEGRVHQTDISSIDKIVAALGNLWRVPGFDLPDVAQGDL
jgi:hypothetical protein